MRFCSFVDALLVFLVVTETHQTVFNMLRLCLYQDHYKVLGVDYDATDDSIRTSYLRLALKWHPDKHNGSTAATLKFQEINEAYRVLSDPLMRHEYDMQGNYGLQDYNYTVSNNIAFLCSVCSLTKFEIPCVFYRIGGLVMLISSGWHEILNCLMFL
ncbi:hypothetical protein KC19_4G193200 [Ceratodon purpureus]|uniref:J domain-containing protein n=1 Tax=Ceratodon purpureus TaxID=3225 RepID=A0A8T0ICJ2_CERPU|nr:hypothetical protein KC19_4G193200 [Ceratodon purpureus]